MNNLRGRFDIRLVRWLAHRIALIARRLVHWSWFCAACATACLWFCAACEAACSWFCATRSAACSWFCRRRAPELASGCARRAGQLARGSVRRARELAGSSSRRRVRQLARGSAGGVHGSLLVQNSSGPAKITTFTALLASVSDEHLRGALRQATNRFLGSTKINIKSNDLLHCTANVYHGIQVPVINMHGETVIQHIRCTGEVAWHGNPHDSTGYG